MEKRKMKDLEKGEEKDGERMEKRKMKDGEKG